MGIKLLPIVLFGFVNGLTENRYYQLRGDVGGFGVSSELVLNLLASVECRFSNTLGVELG